MRKRKPYRRKPVMLNAHMVVVSDSQKLSEGEVVDLLNGVYLPLAAIEGGNGTTENVNAIGSAAQIAYVLAKAGGGARRAAMESIVEVIKDVWAIDGRPARTAALPEVARLREFLSLYGDILRTVTRGQFIEAIRESNRRVSRRAA